MCLEPYNNDQKAVKTVKKSTIKAIKRNRNIFVKNVKGAIESSGKSISAVAEGSEMSRAHLYNMLQGNSAPTLDSITKLGSFLKVPVGELISK